MKLKNDFNDVGHYPRMEMIFTGLIIDGRPFVGTLRYRANDYGPRYKEIGQFSLDKAQLTGQGQRIQKDGQYPFTATGRFEKGLLNGYAVKEMKNDEKNRYFTTFENDYRDESSQLVKIEFRKLFEKLKEKMNAEL